MRLKIYYLDDEKDLLDMFNDTFSTSDCEITTFLEPQLFLETVKVAPPDLIFLDYRLPGCTGDEIAQKLDEKLLKILITGILT